MKVAQEDDNLKVVKKLQKELNDLKINNPLHRVDRTMGYSPYIHTNPIKKYY